MKKSLCLILACVMLSPVVFAKKKKGRYPVVISVTNAELMEDQVEVVARQAKHSNVNHKLHVGQYLHDKALIDVKDDGQVRLDLGPKSSLIIFGNSRVEIPVIAWEDGAIEKIILKKGRIRYDCEDNCHREIRTDLYQETPSAGDFVFTYEPQVPKMEALVLSGELPFRGFENETHVVLKEGQKASFTGVLENSEVAYDILLQGRKVAKGKLSEVQTLSEEEKKKFEKLFTEKKMVKKAAKEQRLPNQICAKPFAELNQCRWVCNDNPKKAKTCALDQGAKCIRSRCNANGEWAEDYELPNDQSKCGLKPIVAACDY